MPPNVYDDAMKTESNSSMNSTEASTSFSPFSFFGQLIVFLFNGWAQSKPEESIDVDLIDSASSNTMLHSLSSSSSGDSIELSDDAEVEGNVAEDPVQQNVSDDGQSEQTTSSNHPSEDSASSSSEENEVINTDLALALKEFEINASLFSIDDPDFKNLFNTELKEWETTSEETKQALFQAAEKIDVEITFKLIEKLDLRTFMEGLISYHGMTLTHVVIFSLLAQEKEIEKKFTSPEDLDANILPLYEAAGDFFKRIYGFYDRDISPFPWEMKIQDHPNLAADKKPYINKSVQQLLRSNFKGTGLDTLFPSLLAEDNFRRNSIFYRAFTTTDEETDRRRDKAADIDLDGDSRAEGFFRLFI